MNAGVKPTIEEQNVISLGDVQARPPGADTHQQNAAERVCLETIQLFLSHVGVDVSIKTGASDVKVFNESAFDEIQPALEEAICIFLRMHMNLFVCKSEI